MNETRTSVAKVTNNTTTAATQKIKWTHIHLMSDSKLQKKNAKKKKSNAEIKVQEHDLAK